MARGKDWSPKELETLEKNYIKLPIESVMELLPGRSKYAIQWKANSLGLIIRDGKSKKAFKKRIVNLTEEQDDYLKEKRNGSRVIRDALTAYIKKNPPPS